MRELNACNSVRLLCEHIHTYIDIYKCTYIQFKYPNFAKLCGFLIIYTCVCVFVPVCVPTHASCECLSAPVTVFVRLRWRWNGTPTFCHRTDFTEPGLSPSQPASQPAGRSATRPPEEYLDSVFMPRTTTAISRHRLVIHVCFALPSAAVQISSREAPSCPPMSHLLTHALREAPPPAREGPSSQLMEHAAVSIYCCDYTSVTLP